MPKYRKKPVEIEAERFWVGEGPIEGVTEIMALEAGLPGRDPDEIVGRVETLEGPIFASDGDWIITGVQGERYPCKPDIFESTYEPA